MRKVPRASQRTLGSANALSLRPPTRHQLTPSVRSPPTRSAAPMLRPAEQPPTAPPRSARSAAAVRPELNPSPPPPLADYRIRFYFAVSRTADDVVSTAYSVDPEPNPPKAPRILL